ncbi:hypothetical protein RAB80_013547 [Fusarium oxysporum f. sp. vasinfectum]|nr:hypothetical protein RAB80_013547 [Fusarium oxysporum f. sp. vasinfectum]
MQAPSSGSQRAFAHRRSPGAEPGPPPNVPVRSISPALQARASSASARSVQSTGSRRMNREGSGSGSNMPLSQIEKSVTHLLVATKQLLETLTQWSRGQATDSQVSDVYATCPDLLRHILEATLSQEASAESLEKYLPRIRDIIINLLHGLKRKQQKLRQKQARDRDGHAPPDRATSVSTVGSGNSGLTNMLEEGLENGFQPDSQPTDSLRQSGGSTNQSPRRFNAQRESSRASAISEQSSLSSNTMQSMPVVPPYPEGESSIPTGPPAPPGPPGGELNIDSFPSASTTSARQYLECPGSSAEGWRPGKTSFTQIFSNSPVPNRGRKEVRESLRAVQGRQSIRHNRNTSSQSLRTTAPAEDSPVRIPDSVSEESSLAELPAKPDPPTVQTPDEAYAASATLSGPPTDPMFFSADAPETPKVEKPKVEPEVAPTPQQKPAETSYFQDSPPPTPTKDLTLFLQYKSKVKKFVLPEGRAELTIGRLQLAFIEKFSWNTQHNGADLPEIYIQDPVSGVRHELEDLADVKDRTVLVLNVEALDEVKKHIDDGIASLTEIVRDVKQTVTDQGAALQRVSDRQQEAANEMARLALSPPSTSHSSDGTKTQFSSGRKLDSSHLGELKTLRRDLAIMRQTYSNFQADIQDSMATIRAKAANVKVATAKAAIPDIEGDAGYSYVTSGRKQLNSDSDRLVGKVDDLQDLIEDLRKDVVHRGVRPLPRQLDSVGKDIATLTKELKRMEEYMTQEKPIWTKIWEKELEDVCQGRDELRLMEDLLVDLRDDLEKASETFTLVEQATKEQMKDNGTGASAGSARQFSKGLINLGNSADQSAAKEGVLGEVRALQPNHEDRLEAIERAEKLRQKELATRQVNPLHREITNFVADGKLKKSGGFEEVERARKAKDDRIRREVWQRQNGIIPENPIGEEGADAEADLEDEDAAFLRELEEDEARQAQAQADAEAEANQPPPPPPKDDDDKQPDQPNGA